MGKMIPLTENQALAKKIEDAIANSNFDKSAVAAALGVSKQAVNGWLKTGRIGKSTLAKFASLLELPLSHFMPAGTSDEPCEGPPTGDEIVELLSFFVKLGPEARRDILDLAKIPPVAHVES